MFSLTQHNQSEVFHENIFEVQLNLTLTKCMCVLLYPYIIVPHNPCMRNMAGVSLDSRPKERPGNHRMRMDETHVILDIFHKTV